MQPSPPSFLPLNTPPSLMPDLIYPLNSLTIYPLPSLTSSLLTFVPPFFVSHFCCSSLSLLLQFVLATGVAPSFTSDFTFLPLSLQISLFFLSHFRSISSPSPTSISLLSLFYSSSLQIWKPEELFEHRRNLDLIWNLDLNKRKSRLHLHWSLEIRVNVHRRWRHMWLEDEDLPEVNVRCDSCENVRQHHVLVFFIFFLFFFLSCS